MELKHLNLTIEDGILLHLHQFSIFEDEFDVPFEITQSGIAEAIGIRRSHVSYSLKDLKRKGHVFEQLAHIQDNLRKRKVYFLTPSGKDYAQKLRNNVGQKKIQFKKKSGQVITVKLSDLNKHLGVTIPISQLISYLSPEGYLDYQEVMQLIRTSEKLKEIKKVEFKPVKFIDNMTQPTRFIGRREELTRIKAWINDKLPQIIIIKGIPGIGKTTLASKIISDKVSKGDVSLFWYRIHEWDTLRGILADLAEFLSELNISNLKSYLASHTSIELPEIKKIIEIDFKTLNVIMVFDDFQKINKSLYQLFSLFIEILGLGKSPDVKILILTRGETKVYDRRQVAIKKLVAEFELGGLNSNDSKHLLNLDNITDSEFKKIYKITEGHPLSIELIAIDMKSRIDESYIGVNLEELFKDQHDINRYIREEIFLRLSTNEKKLLNLISVFRYPVPTKAILIDKKIDYESIDSLLSKSLIHETTSDYDVHELVKEFFYRRLPIQHKIKCHKEAAKYYSSKLSVTDEQMGDNVVLDPKAAIEAQYHYLNANNQTKAASLIVEFGTELINQGFTEELGAILKKLNPKEISKNMWVEILIHKGNILTINGDWDTALGCFQDSYEMCKKLNDNCGIARAFNAIGAIYYRKGDWKKARKYYDQGLIFATKENDIKNCSKLYSNIALIHWGNNELSQAVDLTKKSLQLSKKLSDKQGIARSYNNLGIIYWEERKLDEAISAFNKSLKLSEELDDKHTIAILYDNLGEVYRLKGNQARAVKFYERSLKISKELGFKWQIAEIYSNLGSIFKVSNKSKSDYYLKAALELYTALGAKREVEKVKEIIKKD